MGLLKRFLSKFDKGEINECWEWSAYVDKNGYGRIGLTGGGNERAHRVSYSIFIGDIPKGKFICHKCDNRKCVNPSHLFLGDIYINNKDRSDKGRSHHKVSCQGEEQPNHKLNNVTVLEIRRKRSLGYTQQKLADEFNISRPSISFIINRKTWKHI